MRPLFRGTSIVALVLAVCSCTPPPPDQLILKAYDVPMEHAAELQGIVQGLLWVGKDQPRKGAAALAPSGQLLVSAPAGFQPGIADVITRLKNGGAQRSPTVTLDYWIIIASKAEAATKGADVAPEIGDVLDTLQKSQGPMKMALFERLKLSSQSGSDAKVDGALVRADQTAALHGKMVVAQVSLRRNRGDGGLEARVEIPLGETVVLGQAGTMLDGGGPSSFADETKRSEPVTAFYVVRAAVDGR